MRRYSKGARGERELLNELYTRGYSVIRSAGSGVNSISPDIIGFKQGRGLAFECKAWDKDSLSLEPQKIDVLSGWERNTGMNIFIAWRMNHTGWFFIKLNELEKNGKNYTVTKKRTLEINRRLEALMQ